MWQNCVNFLFDTLSRIGALNTWLFNYISLPSEMREDLPDWLGTAIDTFLGWFHLRPIDLLGIGGIALVIILLLIHLVNVIAG